MSLYRGRDGKGQWHEGSLVQCSTKHSYIVSYFEPGEYLPNEVLFSCKAVYHKVKNKTLGQYTGFADRENIDICKGDVIEAINHMPNRYVIDFIDGAFCATHPKLEGFPIDLIHFYDSTGCMIKVIGNVHDNPELIQQEVSDEQHKQL